MRNEKNMSFLVITKIREVWKKVLKKLEWSPLIQIFGCFPVAFLMYL